MRAPKNSETGVKMAGSMCTRPSEGLYDPGVHTGVQLRSRHNGYSEQVQTRLYARKRELYL